MDTRLMRLLALLLALITASAAAQSWPQRPVHVIVPFVAGGNTDSQARIVAERLNEALGQPFVVENKVGAGGAIAAEYVAKSAPDGYTLFFAASPQFSLPLVQKVNFDPLKDFAPISIVAPTPSCSACTSRSRPRR
jgi:tripartite-type tricarboxylate transporter receptor subunit TctC